VTICYQFGPNLVAQPGQELYTLAFSAARFAYQASHFVAGSLTIDDRLRRLDNLDTVASNLLRQFTSLVAEMSRPTNTTMTSIAVDVATAVRSV
jgi:hypothetical protein